MILKILGAGVGLLLLLAAGPTLLGIRFIPNTRVGIVEKLWSSEGPIAQGRFIALDGEAGYQSEVLRGGLHFGYWPWLYRIHKVPLVVISEGKIGYVFARDGQPLRPDQTLGRVGACNHFQNARAFLMGQAGDPDVVGPAGPAAGDPPRGRLRHQPRPVHGHHRRDRAICCRLAAGTKPGRSSAGTRN